MFLWGGSGRTDTSAGTRYTFLNDWWHFAVSSSRWSQLRPSDDHQLTPAEVGAAPYPSRYTPVFHSAGSEYFLFGGYTEDRLGKRKLNDAWIGDGTTWQPLAVTGLQGYDGAATWPGVRYGCMSAASGSEVFVCGWLLGRRSQRRVALRHVAP